MFWVGLDPVHQSFSRAIGSVAHDGLPVGLICLFLLLSSLTGIWVLRALLRLPALLLLLAMAVDTGTRTLLAFRLNWDDLLPYMDWQLVLKTGLSSPFLTMVVIAVVGAVIVPTLVMSLGRRGTALSAGAGVLALGLFAFSPSPSDDISSWKWRNVLSHNLLRGLDRPLPPGDSGVAQPGARCERLDSEQHQYKMVLLVVIDSLSSYQTGVLGNNDWTPEFDKLARKGWLFSNFHANGFNTAGGLTALLTGDIPVQPPASLDTRAPLYRQAASDSKRNLLRLMDEAGWQSYYLTPRWSEFAGKKSWLERIGFQHIDDSSSVFYDGMRNYLFEGAADTHLYRRSLEVMEGAQAPWLMVLEATSTQPPHISESSMKEAVRYADRQLGTFVKSLHEEKFFDFGGLLIVTGDHRDATHQTSAEREVRGHRAGSWVPLLMYAGDQTSRRSFSQLYQQTDLYNGLRSLVSRVSCTNAWRGDVFQAVPAKCTFYAPGGNRSYLYQYCGSRTFILHLNGTDTGPLFKGSPPDWTVPLVNSLRLRE